jgi:tRNA(fMet)-specific endonuclease VapC
LISFNPLGHVIRCEVRQKCAERTPKVRRRGGVIKFDFDAPAAEEYTLIQSDLETKGTPIDSNDLMIAAIAKANHLTLITHNTAEFQRVVGLMLDDWII